MITLTPPRAEDRFTSVLHFTHENAATLDVADLAAQAGYSPFHFTRIFSARMGIGPGQYLTALRIDAAKRMLLAGDDAVIDVARASAAADCAGSDTPARPARSRFGTPGPHGSTAPQEE